MFTLIPTSGERALDIGARDGYLAIKLAERFRLVVALDLEKPSIDHPRVQPVKGNAAQLEFPDNYFDTVLCAEVLEHIPARLLPKVCSEITRVASSAVVIGVPYRQDLRYGRTTCQTCGQSNPPWGHVNSFDEERLRQLFSGLVWQRATFVGTTLARTNFLSAALSSFAGNPYGTWDQEEPCVHCGANIGKPATRNIVQRIATRAAFILNRMQSTFIKPQSNWIHVLLTKADRTQQK